MLSDVAPCRSCGCFALDYQGDCPSLADRGPFSAGQFFRCQRCGLGQRHPIPDDRMLSRMYLETPPETMAYRFEDNAAWSAARIRLLQRFDANAEPWILDIGCHTGTFLSAMPPRWRRFGVESARQPMLIAERSHRVDVIASRLESIGPEWSQRFDIVTMFDVVEHLPDPAAGIAQAAHLLKPKGWLIISTGDLDAWTWRWLGSGHWYLQTPQHLSVLSQRFLKHVAARVGLTIRELRSIPHKHASWKQRLRDGIKIAYWGMRQRRGSWRIPHRFLQSLTGLQELRHLQRVPWAMTLSDHLVAALER